MGSTFHNLVYHLVFGTKDRSPLLEDPWRDQLFTYLGGAVRGLGGNSLGVGGYYDHVHILVKLPPAIAPANFVRELKKGSSRWVKEHHGPGFAWQEGYALFGISHTHVASVRRYVLQQVEHHQVVSFREEVARLLKVNGVDFDPAYLP
ncbi:MAG: transposase-like protein [Puniceicoccaceae bacterium 5H]|nr:MAG: transposase-like protein [Puniceicoccaceae bacterium 5H]